jgi:hypothetical protein
VRVLVCGSRDWTDGEAIRRELAKLPAGSVILHGDHGYDAKGRPLWGLPDELAVRGADKLAGQVARKLGFQVVVFTPEWDRYGSRAGPLRNTEMLEERPELVLAFHPDLESSRDTADTVRKARNRGMDVRVIAG